MRRGLFLRLLIALTLVTAALAAWRWVSLRQEAMRRIEAQSQPSLSATSLSRAPDFSLQTLAGQTVRLADLRGKVVLINFWATWCPPCKAEMPDLNALQQTYASQHDFLVLGVNVEEDAATVTPFIEEQGVEFPIVLDEDGRVTSELFRVRPLPTTFVIDREGFIRDLWNGQIAQEAMLARLKRVW